MSLDPERLLIGVVAHVSRERMAHKLAERTQAQVFNMDVGRGRSEEDAVAACVANHLEVLRQLQSQATAWNPWCIVLEDDALPVKDFRIHAAAALYYAGSPMVGFYIGRVGASMNLEALEKARESGLAWTASNHMLSAVAYALRTDELPTLIEHYEHEPPGATVERRITNWAMMRRSTVWSEPRFYYTIPSLVDHSSVDSIIYGASNSDIRRAWSVGTADNWHTPAVEYDPDT